MMLEAITDPLIRSHIEDAFLQYHQGRIERLLPFEYSNEHRLGF